MEKSKKASAQKLTPRQEKFVSEYLKTGNATKSAIAAGYNEKTAAPAASRMLRNVKVSRAIEARQAKRNERCEMEEDWELKHAQEVALRCLQATPVKDMFGKKVRDEDGNILYTFNARDAVSALTLVAKLRGKFIDRKQIDLSVDIPGRLDEYYRTIADDK